MAHRSLPYAGSDRSFANGIGEIHWSATAVGVSRATAVTGLASGDRRESRFRVRTMTMNGAALRRAVAGWARLLGPGRNPLRRPVDRLQGIILLTVVLIGLAVVPIALLVGQEVRQRQEQAAELASVDRYEVAAELTQNVQFAVTDNEAQSLYPTSAIWQLPNGPVYSGSILAPSGSSKGERVMIWVSADGNPVAEPLTVEQAYWQGVLITLVVLLGSLIVLSGLYGIVSWVLFRARLARWAREWDAVGPYWTGQFF